MEVTGRSAARRAPHRLWRHASLAALLVLPALAHASDYVEPSGDTTASVEFINEAAQIMSIDIYADAKECTDRGHTYAKAKEVRKLSVATGKNLAFTVAMDPKGAGAIFAFGALGAALGADMFKGCRPVIEFLPEQGHNYVLRMNSDGKDCVYKFYENPAGESSQASEGAHVPFVEREFARAWGNSGPWCKKKIADEPK